MSSNNQHKQMCCSSTVTPRRSLENRSRVIRLVLAPHRHVHAYAQWKKCVKKKKIERKERTISAYWIILLVLFCLGMHCTKIFARKMAKSRKFWYFSACKETMLQLHICIFVYMYFNPCCAKFNLCKKAVFTSVSDCEDKACASQQGDWGMGEMRVKG